MSKFIQFPHDIETVFFVLGFACNFKCKYCLQHALKTNDIRKTYNPDIIPFIQELANKRKEHEKSPLHVQFFGGESLLYMDIIKDAVDKLKNDYVYFSTITNGSLITSEIADWLNEHNFSIAISWDGRQTKKTRFIDVIEQNKDNIYKLNNWSTSCVITPYSYPREFLHDMVELDEDYKKVTGKNKDISWNIDSLYNFENPNQSDVFEIDFDYLASEIREMAYNYIKQNGKNHPIEDIFIMNHIDYIKNYKEELKYHKFSACMNGIKILNVNCDGNLDMCHDKKIYLGSIYSDYEDYMKEYFKNNKLPEYYKEHCVNCNVRFICNGGCMVLTNEERENFYCPQRRATFGPIVEELMKNAL